MTALEILKQAKDDVAKKHGFDNFEECYFFGLETCTAELLKYSEEASLLAMERIAEMSWQAGKHNMQGPSHGPDKSTYMNNLFKKK